MRPRWTVAHLPRGSNRVHSAATARRDERTSGNRARNAVTASGYRVSNQDRRAALPLHAPMPDGPCGSSRGPGPASGFGLYVDRVLASRDGGAVESGEEGVDVRRLPGRRLADQRPGVVLGADDVAGASGQARRVEG